VYASSSIAWTRESSLPVPLRHRVMWSPITAAICLAGMIVADVLLGMTAARVAGLAIGATWLGLALYNRHTRGAFLRKTYAPSMEDDAPTARVVEPAESQKS
jgi:hypothetical protein